MEVVSAVKARREKKAFEKEAKELAEREEQARLNELRQLQEVEGQDEPEFQAKIGLLMSNASIGSGK